MKPIFRYAPALAVLLSLTTACDNLDYEERFEPVVRPEAQKTILIQEFTGQTCTNCPDGAAAVHAIQETYPESVIAVCLHPEGTYYNRQLGNVVLVSKLARVYYDTWRPQAFPAAVIDGSRANTNYMQWAGLASKAVEISTPAGILLEAFYDPDTRNITVGYNAYFTDTYADGDVSILVWIVEDGIIAPQQTMSGDVPDYEHNHVLRCSLNGDWGEPLQTTLAGTSNHGTVSGTLDEAWNAENCKVVAVLFNSSTRADLQAAQIDVPAGEQNVDSN